MSVLDSQKSSPRRYVVSCFTVGLLVGLGAYLMRPVMPAAQEASGPCAASNPPISKDFLACVRGALDAVGNERVSQGVLDEPLHGYLRTLAQTLGYAGAKSDLDALKTQSTALKRDPVANREAIALLDNAIASHVDELRPAVSREALAAKHSSGTDIYPRFVEQKLAFLSTDETKFYDGGPFEVVRRSLLANTLEGKYFMNQGDPDQSLLHKEIEVLDEIHVRLTDPKYAYLSVPPANRNARINSNRFWRASLLFVLGEKTELREMLRDIATRNQEFGIETTNPGHVYIYKTLDFPFKILLQGIDKDGKPIVETNDPHILNRFYNPAQLALRVCDLVKVAGPSKAETLARVISDLDFNDFYVVAASTNDTSQLQQFVAAVNQALEVQALRQQRDDLVKRIAAQAETFSNTMKRGAQACGIEDAVRDKIYSAFEFKPQLKHIDGFGKQSEYLVFGGRLDANQANIVVDFLNKYVFADPALHALQTKMKIDSTAYAARVRIQQ